MARLASDSLRVSIQTFIGVQLGVVAVGASHLLRRFDDVVISDEFAFNGVILCGVAIGALQIEFAHMHVGLDGGIVQTLVEIAVFDGVPAATGKMALDRQPNAGTCCATRDSRLPAKRVPQRLVRTPGRLSSVRRKAARISTRAGNNQRICVT